jgi:hypothetical protein
VGRPTHPWQTAETRIRGHRIDSIQIHDPTPRAALADLAFIPAQHCRRHRGDRSVRGSHPDVRVPVCLSGRRPRSTTVSLVCGDPASDGGVVGAVEAFAWDAATTYLVRDNGPYGLAFRRQIRTWEFGTARYHRPRRGRTPMFGRLIGTLRHDCLDHVLIFGERLCARCKLRIRSITMRRARTWGWARTCRCDEPSNALDPSSSHSSCPVCIIASADMIFGKDRP